MTQIKVCNVALTRDTVDRARLLELLPAEVVDEAMDRLRGCYARSPDDWAPYTDGRSVSEHLVSAGIEAVTYTSKLLQQPPQPDLIDLALVETQLFIIDPLWLLLSGQDPRLPARIEMAIRAGRKYVCVVMPAALTGPLAEAARAACERELSLVAFAYANGRAVGLTKWLPERPDELLDFLRRVGKELAPAADPARVATVQEFFESLGVRNPPISIPRLAGQPA